MKKLNLIICLCALCVLGERYSIAAVKIDNGPASNITTTAADVFGTVTSTNGSGTNTVVLYYGTTDYSNNAASWASSNVYYDATNAALGTISTNITGLTPASKYYFRWYLLESTNSDWSDSTSNFWTLAGVPTNTPPAAPYRPLMVDTSGAIAAPANFLAANGIAGTNDTASLQAQIGSNDVDIASALAQVSSNDTDIASALAQVSSNDTDIASAFSQIGSNDVDIAGLGADIAPTNSFSFLQVVVLKPTDNLTAKITDTNTLYILPPGTFTLTAHCWIPHGSTVRGAGHEVTSIDGAGSYDFGPASNALVCGIEGLRIDAFMLRPESATPVAQQTVYARNCYLDPDAGPCFAVSAPSNLVVHAEHCYMGITMGPDATKAGWWSSSFWGLDGGAATYLTRDRYAYGVTDYTSNLVVRTVLTMDGAYMQGTFTTNTPSDGMVAKYNSATGKWYAAPDNTSTGVASILDDGTVPMAANFNGGGFGFSNWFEIGYFTTNAPTDGQVAKYNATDQRWYAADDTAGGGGGSGTVSGKWDFVDWRVSDQLRAGIANSYVLTNAAAGIGYTYAGFTKDSRTHFDHSTFWTPDNWNSSITVNAKMHHSGTTGTTFAAGIEYLTADGTRYALTNSPVTVPAGGASLTNQFAWTWTVTLTNATAGEPIDWTVFVAETNAANGTTRDGTIYSRRAEWLGIAQ